MQLLLFYLQQIRTRFPYPIYVATNEQDIGIVRKIRSAGFLTHMDLRQAFQNTLPTLDVFMTEVSLMVRADSVWVRVSHSYIS